MINASPKVGMGYRAPIDDWTVVNLDRFDVLEVTVDHYLCGGAGLRDSIRGLVGLVPLTAHGIGLSIGTDQPPDPRYLDRVADVLALLKVPSYSEHLAFTKAWEPDGKEGMRVLDLANLLPLPKTLAVAETVIRNIEIVRSRIDLPLHLENISYLFEWDDSVIDEVEFLKLVCRETGADILLDVENLYVNARNHDYDPHAFVEALPVGSVKGVHLAGGALYDGLLADTHDHRVPDEALDLLDYVLARQRPDTVILERDDKLEKTDDIMADVERIRTRVDRLQQEKTGVEPAAARASV